MIPSFLFYNQHLLHIFVYRVKTIKTSVMKKNMGMVDKTVRLVLAALAVVLYFLGAVKGTLALVVLIIAILLVVTSLVSFCPLYTLFGWNTDKKKE